MSYVACDYNTGAEPKAPLEIRVGTTFSSRKPSIDVFGSITSSGVLNKFSYEWLFDKLVI